MATETTSVSPPVEPQKDLLAFDDLKPDEFENFCRDLVGHQPSVVESYRYGKQGDEQAGIDVVARYEDGTRSALQCKHYTKFTAAHARSVVDTVQRSLDNPILQGVSRYILALSTEASAAVRDVINEHPGWELWDVHELSRMVRELPLAKARRLIAQYFGNHWLKAFLGVPSLECFLGVKDYFKKRLDPMLWSHHRWDLVGRSEILSSMNALLQPQNSAGLLYGRGGAGKTKLLYEWARQLTTRTQDLQILFVESGLDLDRAAADELPPGPCILILDDAQEANARRQVEVLLTIARQREAPTKILLSGRPYAVPELKTLLLKGGIDPRALLTWGVPELGWNEIVALARQALGSEYARLAEQLAAVTRDSPLTTVLGGKLVAEHHIAPHQLAGQEKLWDYLFARFEEFILGKVGDTIGKERCANLLRLLSVLSPFDTGNEFLRQAACEFLEMSNDALLAAIHLLVNAGGLLRSGESVRVTPDLLAEHIVYRACIGPERLSTGYAEKVFEKFAGYHPVPLMRNLSALSRQCRDSGQGPRDFLEEQWQSLKGLLRKGTTENLSYVLSMVSAAAYHEPQRVLDAIGTALNALVRQNPDALKGERSPAVQVVLERVFFALWRILQGAERGRLDLGVHEPRCLDLLWWAGKDDKRELKMELVSDHGMVLLHKMARYWPDRPTQRYEAVLDAVERWLAEADVFEHVHTPLPVLDALLKKEGRVFIEHEDNTFETIESLADTEEMCAIRKRALGLVFRCARVGKPRVIARALISLQRVLKDPAPAFSHLSQQPGQWLAEQRNILQFLERFVAENQEPCFQFLTVETLWPAIGGRLWSDLQPQVLRVVDAVQTGFKLRLTRVLAHNLTDSGFIGPALPPEVRERWPARDNLLPSVVDQFISEVKEPTEGHRLLNERLTILTECSKPHRPEPFLEELTRRAPAYAQALCEQALSDEHAPWVRHVYVLIETLRRGNTSQCFAVAQKLVDSGALTLAGGVARGYAIAVSPDMQGRKDPLPLPLEPAEVELLLGVPVGTNVKIAESLSKALLTVVLSEQQLLTFLRKLAPVDRLDEHWIQQLLLAAVERVPGEVLDLMLARIEHWEPPTPHPEQPVPREGASRYLEVLEASADAPRYLQKVLDRMKGSEASQRKWLALLFNRLSSRCGSPAALALLEEQSRVGDTSALDALASILSHAPEDFVITRFELTRRLLERAAAVGGKKSNSLIHRLLQRAVNGLGEGDWSGPVPRNAGLPDQARHCLERLPPGSAAFDFYEALREMASRALATP